jgi:hypothetical protein
MADNKNRGSQITEGAFNEISDYVKTLPVETRSDTLQGIIEGSNTEIDSAEKSGTDKEQIELLRSMVKKLSDLKDTEEKNAKPLVDFLNKHDGKIPASIALHYDESYRKTGKHTEDKPLPTDPEPAEFNPPDEAQPEASNDAAPDEPATAGSVKESSEQGKMDQEVEHQTKKKKVIVETEKKVTEKEAENLKLRKQLVDIEEKQRSIYEKNVSKEEVQSKVLFQRSNKALEELLKHTKDSQEVIVNFSDEQQKVLESIRDLLKESRSASLEDLPKIQDNLEYLKGKGYQLGKNSPQFKDEFDQQAKIANQIVNPPYSVAQRVGASLKDSAKDFGQFVYSAVPEPLKILGEGAASVAGGLYRAVTGNHRRTQEETASFGRGRIDALGSMADDVRGAINRNEHQKGFGVFSGKGSNAPRVLSGVAETFAGALAKTTGAAKTVKMPEVDIGKLSIDLISFKDIDDNDGKLAKILKKAFSGGNGSGGIEGILKDILSVLGKSALVAGAGILGYEIGKEIDKNLLQPLMEKLTGQKGETVGTGTYQIIDKLQDLHLVNGVSDNQLMQYASQGQAGKIAQQYLKAGRGHISEKQAEFLKKEGVDIPKDLIVGGKEGARLDALAAAAHDAKPTSASTETPKAGDTPKASIANPEDMGPPAPDKSPMSPAAMVNPPAAPSTEAPSGATAVSGAAKAVAAATVTAKDSQAKAVMATQATSSGEAGARARSVGMNSRTAAMAMNSPKVIVAPVPSAPKTPSDKGGGDDGALPIVTGAARNQENAFASYQQQVFSPY